MECFHLRRDRNGPSVAHGWRSTRSLADQDGSQLCLVNLTPWVQAWLFPVTGWTSGDPSSFLCDMEKYNAMYERSIGPNREAFWANRRSPFVG